MAAIIILISADAEWQAACTILQPMDLADTPYGKWFQAAENLIFLHGGWGKIAAAGSTQYAIDRWHPEIIINLGTCGGFEGEIERGEIIMVEQTVVYDILEQMGDSEEHIAYYATRLDLSWLKGEPPITVHRTLLVSGDRDLLPEDIPSLQKQYGAVAGDWESGAIAWVAARNQTPALILRGVTDLVDATGGEAYGNLPIFTQRTMNIMRKLLDTLPSWLELWKDR